MSEMNPLTPRRGWHDYELEPNPWDSEEMARYIRRAEQRTQPSFNTTSSGCISLPNPQIGEYWWVGVTSTPLLIKVKVNDVTPNTIDVSSCPSQAVLCTVRFISGRYRKGFLSFVERVIDAPSVEPEPTQPTA